MGRQGLWRDQRILGVADRLDCTIVTQEVKLSSFALVLQSNGTQAICMIHPSKGRDTLVLCLQFCESGCRSDERFVVVHIVRWLARQISGSVWTGRGSSSTKPVLGFETLVQTVRS